MKWPTVEVCPYSVYLSVLKWLSDSFGHFKKAMAVLNRPYFFSKRQETNLLLCYYWAPGSTGTTYPVHYFFLSGFKTKKIYQNTETGLHHQDRPCKMSLHSIHHALEHAVRDIN